MSCCFAVVKMAKHKAGRCNIKLGGIQTIPCENTGRGLRS
jgi:hypothetical protein